MKVLSAASCLLAAWAAAAPAAPPDRAAVQAGPPRIAVVLDDFGLTYKKNVPDEKWMAVRWPVTFAVMPESPRTRQAARETLANGHELIIHFPFDPFLKLDLPKGSASPADLEKVRKLFDRCLAHIPGAKGVNNHRSFRATQNRPMMAEFMKLVRERGMFFVDSGVSTKSVALAEARAAGLKAGRGGIFLEDGSKHDKPVCVRLLRRAAAMARKNGSVIAIGHHYWQGTYDCLTEQVPKLQQEGFEFVFASAVVR
ncbi:MAG: divergent polysaccharide deacetylase family protein [Elusimicrobia bacterium]|nr:divergent polysaccharide deacetylase family protein [Elusimicrobiota bacterium]